MNVSFESPFPFLDPREASAATNWYDSNYAYRMAITINASIYGSYPIPAIIQAIKHGGKTAHPEIPFSAWQRITQNGSGGRGNFKFK